MPHLKSLFPDPPPNPPLLNAYLSILGRPDQDKWPDFIAHIETISGRTISFHELRRRVNDLATALGAPIHNGGLGMNATTGEMIGIMSDNSSDYITLVNSCLKIAAPFALLSCYSTPFELRHALSIIKLTRLFVAPQYLPMVIPVASEFGLSRDNIYFMNQDIQGAKSVESFIRDVRMRKIPEESVRIVPKDTLAYLVFSSGTSGLPKGSWSTFTTANLISIDNSSSHHGLSWEPRFRG